MSKKKMSLEEAVDELLAFVNAHWHMIESEQHEFDRIIERLEEAADARKRDLA